MICDARRDDIAKTFLAHIRTTLEDHPDIKPEEIASIGIGAMLAVLSFEIGPTLMRTHMTHAMDEVAKYHAKKIN